MATAVGYTGGAKPNPTYEQVCSGGTGHAEAVLIEFDPKKLTYMRLLDVFFTSHNPERQCAPGYQYRSEIFSYSDAQSGAASKAVKDRRVSTRVSPASTFWMAEAYHQQYYGKKGAGFCKV